MNIYYLSKAGRVEVGFCLRHIGRVVWGVGHIPAYRLVHHVHALGRVQGVY